MSLRSPADADDSVDELANVIAPHLGLEPENILLFLEDGREVKDRVLHEAHDRGGSGEASQVSSKSLRQCELLC